MTFSTLYAVPLAVKTIITLCSVGFLIQMWRDVTLAFALRRFTQSGGRTFAPMKVKGFILMRGRVSEISLTNYAVQWPTLLQPALQACAGERKGRKRADDFAAHMGSFIPVAQ